MTRTSFSSLLAALLLLASAPAVASPASDLDEYAVDAGHTIVEFSIVFALTRVKGRFTDVHGTLLYDAVDPTNSSVTMVFATKSLDTGWPDRDRHLRTSDFFDVERYPTIVFRSDRLSRAGDGWVAEGSRPRPAVTRPIAVRFDLLPGSPSRRPESGYWTRNLPGTLRLSRTDFGIVGGSSANSWFTRARSATMADSVDI